MLKYIFKRIVIGAITLLILSTITFFGVRAMPGDPFEQDNKVMAPETYEALREKFPIRVKAKTLEREVIAEMVTPRERQICRSRLTNPNRKTTPPREMPYLKICRQIWSL